MANAYAVDVINVLSVTTDAKVNHWIESNDDDTQEALYWRQGYDIRTSELSVGYSSGVRFIGVTR